MVEGDLMPVVGLKTVTELNLVKRLLTIGCKGYGDPQPEILKRYQSQFRGIGTLPGEYEIKIDTSVTPVVHPVHFKGQSEKLKWIKWKEWAS